MLVFGVCCLPTLDVKHLVTIWLLPKARDIKDVNFYASLPASAASQDIDGKARSSIKERDHSDDVDTE